MDRFHDIAGARLRCRRAGRGPAIVFVHGWALDLDMWAPQFAAFHSTFQVIAYDRRGFGLSSGRPSIEGDVEDLGALLDALAVSKAAIVGMSQGARVATRFALRMPERITALVLDGPPEESVPPPGHSFAEVPLERYRALARREGIEAVRREWLEHPLMRLVTGDADTHALLRRIVARYPGRDLDAPAGTVPSIHHVLCGLRVPALVLNGGLDSDRRRESGAGLAGLLPDARHALVPQAGHLPNLDNPAVYCKMLTDFLRAHGVAGVPTTHIDRPAEDTT